MFLKGAESPVLDLYRCLHFSCLVLLLSEFKILDSPFWRFLHFCTLVCVMGALGTFSAISTYSHCSQTGFDRGQTKCYGAHFKENILPLLTEPVHVVNIFFSNPGLYSVCHSLGRDVIRNFWAAFTILTIFGVPSCLNTHTRYIPVLGKADVYFLISQNIHHSQSQFNLI